VLDAARLENNATQLPQLLPNLMRMEKKRLAKAEKGRNDEVVRMARL
jgi:hypothetical protein